MKVNDITISAVVDTAAEITTVAQSVAHIKMSSQPEIIFSKDMNLASCGWESTTEGDRRGPGQTARVRCTITGRLAPGYRFPAFNGVLRHCSTGDFRDRVQSVKARSSGQVLLVRRVKVHSFLGVGD